MKHIDRQVGIINFSEVDIGRLDLLTQLLLEWFFLLPSKKQRILESEWSSITDNGDSVQQLELVENFALWLRRENKLTPLQLTEKLAFFDKGKTSFHLLSDECVIRKQLLLFRCYKRYSRISLISESIASIPIFLAGAFVFFVFLSGEFSFVLNKLHSFSVFDNFFQLLLPLGATKIWLVFKRDAIIVEEDTDKILSQKCPGDMNGANQESKKRYRL